MIRVRLNQIAVMTFEARNNKKQLF